MGWRFNWVSSFGTDFNCDFRVSFTKDQAREGRINYNFGMITSDQRYLTEDLPGVSVFAKRESEVFLTYATFARGLDMLLAADQYLDLTPESRNEKAYHPWPRRFDEYPAKANASKDATCSAATR
jgi:predicted dithiol-disulfide oxidoreductase (DUF899 family)